LDVRSGVDLAHQSIRLVWNLVGLSSRGERLEQGLGCVPGAVGIHGGCGQCCTVGIVGYGSGVERRRYREGGREKVLVVGTRRGAGSEGGWGYAGVKREGSETLEG